MIKIKSTINSILGLLLLLSSPAFAEEWREIADFSSPPKAPLSLNLDECEYRLRLDEKSQYYAYTHFFTNNIGQVPRPSKFFPGPIKDGEALKFQVSNEELDNRQIIYSTTPSHSTFPELQTLYADASTVPSGVNLFIHNTISSERDFIPLQVSAFTHFGAGSPHGASLYGVKTYLVKPTTTLGGTFHLEEKCAYVEGDVNLDGVVELKDAYIIIGNYFPAKMTEPLVASKEVAAFGKTRKQGDLNGDTIVDAYDLMVWYASWIKATSK